MFSIEVLQGSHDRSQFDCGSEALDRYIHQPDSAGTSRTGSRMKTHKEDLIHNLLNINSQKLIMSLVI